MILPGVVETLNMVIEFPLDLVYTMSSRGPLAKYMRDDFIVKYIF